MSYSEPSPASAAVTLLAERLEEGRHAEPLRILSEPEALVVAELLEQIANDQASELSGIAQLAIVRIYDRLETSCSTTEPPPGQGTVPRRKAARTLALLFNPARRRVS
jgi:hypothetical protein